MVARRQSRPCGTTLTKPNDSNWLDLRILPRRRLLHSSLLHPDLLPSHPRCQGRRKWRSESGPYSCHVHFHYLVRGADHHVWPFRALSYRRGRSYHDWGRLDFYPWSNFTALNVDWLSDFGRNRGRIGHTSAHHCCSSIGRAYRYFVHHCDDFM